MTNNNKMNNKPLKFRNEQYILFLGSNNGMNTELKFTWEDYVIKTETDSSYG